MKKFTTLFLALALQMATFEAKAQVSVQTKNYSFNLTSQNPTGQTNFEVSSPIVERTTTVVPEWVVDYREVAIWGTGTCAVQEIVSGDAKWLYDPSRRFASWKQYDYVSSTKEKAKLLADAVQGLGKEFAVDLLKAGYFRQVPNSWNEFEREIHSAEARGIIKQVHETLILKNYGYENRTRLGYYFASTPQMRTVYVPCPQIIGYQNVPDGGHYENRVVVSDRVIGSISRSVNLVISGDVVLTPSERESLTLSFGDLNNVSLSGGKFNTFKAMVREVMVSNESYSGLNIRKIVSEVSVMAVGRVRVDASSIGQRLVETSELRAASTNLSAFTTLSASLRDLITLRNTKGPIVLTTELYACKLNFLGNCLFASYKLVERKQEAVTRLDITTDFNSNQKGMKYYVKTSLNFSNHSLYSGSEISAVESQKVSLK